MVENIPKNQVEQKKSPKRRRYSKRTRIILALASLIGLTGGINAYFDDPQRLLDAKAFLTSENFQVFQHNNLGYERTSELLTKYKEKITSLAQTYGIPEKALYFLAYKEIGEDETNTPFGFGTNLLQHWKAARNVVITKLKPVSGDWTQDGKYHIGLSEGLLNLKPGLATKAVINAIQNDELRKRLLDSYDEERHHTDEDVFCDVVNNFDNALEFAAAHMSLWWEKLKDAQLTEDEKIAIVIESNGSFPYADPNNDGWMYRKYPQFAPDLRDK